MNSGDVEPLVALWSDPDATRYLAGPRDKEWLRAEFRSSMESDVPLRFDLWPAVEKSTGRVVGHCGLLEKTVDGRDEIELVVVFTPSAWGKGYGVEIGTALRAWALAEGGVRRLIALIDPSNRASERLAVRAGFRLEKESLRPGGYIRKVYVFEGEDAASPGRS